MKGTGQNLGAPLHRVYRDRVAPGSEHPASVPPNALALYRVLATCRRLDEHEAELVGRGEAFFHAPSGGHESLAALAEYLTPDDWLHLHYRDKALLLARGVPPDAFLHNLLCTARSSSLGRQMSPFLDDPTLHVLSPNVPVGNNALVAVGVAAEVKSRPGDAIVVCTMGDGTTQQGEVLEAIAQAIRAELPVLFVVEDNRYAISTPTEGRTFFSTPEWCGPPPESFAGLRIHRLDGRDVLQFRESLGPLVRSIRETRRPVLLVVDCERLTNHTNADDQRVYRHADELESARANGDPLRNLRRTLLESGFRAEDLDRIEAEADADLRRASELAMTADDPTPEPLAKAPLPDHLTRPEVECLGQETPGGPRLTMIEAIREVLQHRLQTDPRVTLFGEDIEDPKGDVFGVTRGLSSRFPERVANSPLAESTIVGVSIGRALAGGRPVAFIQFADFLPLAYNQIFCELGSLHWRSGGAWSCPVILMVACGGYRPGLGPFHAETLESLIARVPGVDVMMPSSAGDAAGLLNAAFESNRPTVFFYPKICLNDRDHATSADVDRQLVPIGRARFLSRGDDLTLVTWGSTVHLGRQAAEALANAGCGVDLIDLRTLSPWDERAVSDSARRTGRLLVVHEDARTGGLGGEIVATIAEALGPVVRCRRVTRPDTYVPANFANQLEILPSFRGVLDAAAQMLDLDLTWDHAEPERRDQTIVEAIGSSPADQQVTVIAWHIKPGQSVHAGQRIAELEADKSVFEMVAPVAGVVASLRAMEGQTVRTGKPLLVLETDNSASRRRRPTREVSGRPRLRRRSTSSRAVVSARRETRVGISAPTTAIASRRVTNDDLIRRFPDRTPDDILSRTGIQSRRRLGVGESALSLGVQAARTALERSGLGLDGIDAVICSTETPRDITPSMACLILHELGQGRAAREIPAFDLSAACSGYLYALTVAHDMTLARPDARILIVSAEALSPQADPDDFDTAILFGDAATATILSGPEATGAPVVGRLHRPLISAKGESGSVLGVPHPGQGFVRMDGKRVYAEAVRQMILMLDRACATSGLRRDDLDVVVPHQANGRIIADIRRRLGFPPEKVYVNVTNLGNTCSSTIPLCLAELAATHRPARLGLTAFGGGFTFGAAILELGEPT